MTFHNAENGFCVLRVKARGHRDLVTTVGHAATIPAGEWVTASGNWINDRTHGLQFKAHFLADVTGGARAGDDLDATAEDGNSLRRAFRQHPRYEARTIGGFSGI